MARDADNLLNVKIYTELSGVLWATNTSRSNVTRGDGVTLLNEAARRFGFNLRTKVGKLLDKVSKQYAIEVRKAIQRVIKEQRFDGASVQYPGEAAAVRSSRGGGKVKRSDRSFPSYAEKKMDAVGHLKKLLFTENFIKKVKVFAEADGKYAVRWVGRASGPFASGVTSRGGKRTGQQSLPITNAALAQVMEEGNSHIKARPFMKNAMDEAKKAMKAWKASHDLKGIMLGGKFGVSPGADDGFDRTDMEN